MELGLKMVKGYEQYIKEHFGAITIEYPPEYASVRNPNVPHPLAINTGVGATGRIPMHWNNSPFLAGGFGGSGYGRFGMDPAEENKIELNQEIDNKYDTRFKALIEFSKITDVFYKKEALVYEDIVDNMMNSIENSELDLNDVDTGESELLIQAGIEVSSEEISSPTAGSPGTYWDPPDPGESGEYETQITGTAAAISKLGFDNVSSVPYLDDVGYMSDRTNASILAESFYRYGDIGKSAYALIMDMVNTIDSQLSRLYEGYDEDFDRNLLDGEELIDAVDVEHYGIFKYVMLLTHAIIDNKSEHKKSKVELVKTRPALDFIEISRRENNVSNKTRDLKRVLDMVVNIPPVLKRM